MRKTNFKFLYNFSLVGTNIYFCLNRYAKFILFNLKFLRKFICIIRFTKVQHKTSSEILNK